MWNNFLLFNLEFASIHPPYKADDLVGLSTHPDDTDSMSFTLINILIQPIDNSFYRSPIRALSRKYELLMKTPMI